MTELQQPLMINPPVQTPPEPPDAPPEPPPINSSGGGEMSQWQLIRRSFAKHHLAVISLHLLVLLYLLAVVAETVSPYSPGKYDLDHQYCPPQLPRWNWQHGLHTRAMELSIDPVTFRKTYVERTDAVVPLGTPAADG